jgi:tetratricopeptide (TPR) repeat protein
LKDVSAIQDEISRSIVNELRLTLGRGQRRYNTNIEAYDLYLKARGLQAWRGPATRQAIDLFEGVIAKDPAFAPAYAARASAYGWFLVLQVPSVRGLPVAIDRAHAIVREDAVQAMRLDPLLAEAHDAIGWIHSLDFQWADAEESFRRGLELNPSLTTTYTDFVLSTLMPEGKLDEALRRLNVALNGDPMSADVRRTMSLVQISAGLYDRALDSCRRALAIDAEAFNANTRCEQALLLKGDVAQAVALMQKSVAEDPLSGGGRGFGYLGYAYAITGRRAEAEQQAARNAGLPHQQAMIYAGLGDKDRAFHAIEELAALNPHRARCGSSAPSSPCSAAIRGLGIFEGSSAFRDSDRTTGAAAVRIVLPTVLGSIGRVSSTPGETRHVLSNGGQDDDTRETGRGVASHVGVARARYSCSRDIARRVFTTKRFFHHADESRAVRRPGTRPRATDGGFAKCRVDARFPAGLHSEVPRH